MLLRWLVLAHVATGLQVNEPTALAGIEYEDSPADFAPANYDVTALGVVATSCPCEWATGSSPVTEKWLSYRILIVNDDVCKNSCTAMVAACAAQLANASGVLVTHRYNPSTEWFDGRYRDPAPEGEFAATNAKTNASCQDLIPTAYVTANFTTDLIAAALLVTDAPSSVQPRIGARPTLDALRTRPHPPAVPMRATLAPHRPGAGCTPGPIRCPWDTLAHNRRDLFGWDMHRTPHAHARDVHHIRPLAMAPRRTARSRSGGRSSPRSAAISSFQTTQRKSLLGARSTSPCPM